MLPDNFSRCLMGNRFEHIFIGLVLRQTMFEKELGPRWAAG
jgi:hypothetical protein